MKTLARFAAAATLGAGISVSGLAMAQPTLNVADTASLRTGGGALISVQITCPISTHNVYVSVSLVQEAGAQTASGWAGIGGMASTIACNPESQTVELNVPAFGPNKFQPASVTSYASILECPENDCRSVTIKGNYQTKSVQLVQP